MRWPTARLLTEVRLDLPSLVKEGKITADEATRLSGFAISSDARHLFANVFLIFGALLIVAGVLALKPSTELGLAMASISLISGTALYVRQSKQWWLLGRAAILVGILGLSAWIGLTFADLPKPWPWMTWPLITAIICLAAIAYRDAFLAALAPISLGYALGGGAGYWFASYALFIEESVATAVVFGFVTIALYGLKARIPGRFGPIALVTARVSFLIMNFGFWVGSLWGDYIGSAWWDNDMPWDARKAYMDQAPFVSGPVFAVAWCLLLLVAILLGTKYRQRFISNTSLVFLAVNVYTQFREVLVASPWGLVAGGILLIVLAIGLRRFNRPRRAYPTP